MRASIERGASLGSTYISAYRKGNFTYDLADAFFKCHFLLFVFSNHSNMLSHVSAIYGTGVATRLLLPSP